MWHVKIGLLGRDRDFNELAFYNYILKCCVLINLKIDKLTCQDFRANQMREAKMPGRTNENRSNTRAVEKVISGGDHARGI